MKDLRTCLSRYGKRIRSGNRLLEPCANVGNQTLRCAAGQRGGEGVCAGGKSRDEEEDG